MKIPSRKRIAGAFGPEELEELDKKTLHAVLATSRDNRPYTSLVAYAYDAGRRAFLFLTPAKTTKYSNISSNPNVSLLIDTRENTPSDYMAAEAYTVVGRARGFRAGKRREPLMKVFLGKHPELKAFSRARGVVLVAVSVDFCMKVGRFQDVFLLEDISS